MGAAAGQQSVIPYLGKFASLAVLTSLHPPSAIQSPLWALTGDAGLVSTVGSGGAWGAIGGSGAAVPTPVTSNIVLAAPAVNTLLTNPTAGPLTVTPVPGSGNFSFVEGTSDLSVPLPTENLFLHSGALSNTGTWSATLITSITDNAATDPLGGNTASVLVNGTGTSFLQTVPALTVQPYVGCIWVQGVGASINQAVTLGNFNNSAPREYASIKLDGSWQKIVLPFTPTATTNNNIYLQLNGATTATWGTVPAGASVRVWAPQLNRGTYPKAYAVTTTAQILDSSNYRIAGINSTSAANPIVDFVEESSGIFIGSPRSSSLSGNDPSFLIIRNTGRRESSIVIAAADSINPYASDYICTGSADQTAISNAIFSLRGVGGASGGRVLLRAGTYILTDVVTHDADYVTLEGEARGFWGGYNTLGAYPIISIEGWSGGAKLKQTVSGKGAIVVGTNFQGGGRHQGIGIKNLYLFGYQLTGTAISDTNNTDVSEITDCVIHNFSAGINTAWDTPQISGNSIQSCAGVAVTQSGPYGTIVKNIFYDIGGSAIVLNNVNGQGACQVLGNTIGHVGGSGISVTAGNGFAITGNTIQGVTFGSCIEISGGTQCTINGNSLGLTRFSETNANGVGHGIYLHTSASGCAIAGNTINNQNTSGTGYAIAFGLAGDATVTGCTAVGNAITGGKWNSGSTTTIIDSSGGATNKIAFNAGDTH